MPFRRRPEEPSPRVLAILAAAEAAGREPPARGGLPRDEGQGAPRYFLPDRDQLTRSSRPLPAVPLPSPALDRPPALDPSQLGPPRPRGVPEPVPGRHRRPMPPGPRLLTLPAALRGARTSGPRAAIVGMLAVVVVAGAIFGVRVAWARAASTPEVIAPRSTDPRGAPGRHAGAGAASDETGVAGLQSRSAAPSGFGTPGAARAGPVSPAALVVHVIGQVRRPGVVVLAAGARVRDAVAQAGGATAGADLAALNLARPVVDGEQVRVPKPGEPVPMGPGPGGGVGGADGAARGGPGPGAAPGPVNLNTASSSVLEELPGVGPVLAQRIIEWREQHGGFTAVDELAEVSGIGEKMFAALQDKVTV